MKTFQKFKTGTLLAGAGLVGSLHGSNPGVGEINVELENGSTATLMTFAYLDTASSETRPFQNGKHWYKIQITEYQLSDNVVLIDSTWLKSWDKNFNEKDVFFTSRNFNFREDNRIHVWTGKEIILDDRPTNANFGGGSIHVETDTEWSFTRIGVIDNNVSDYLPVMETKYDKANQQAMGMTHYSKWYSVNSKMRGIKAGFYASLSPSKSTKTLEEMVALTDDYTLNMLPKKNGQIISVPGLTIDLDIYYKLAQIDVSNVQRREKIASKQPPQNGTSLADMQNSPVYATAATLPAPEIVSTPTPVSPLSHAGKLKAEADARRQRDLERLMKEIEANGGSVGQTPAKRRPVTSQPSLPREVVLATNSPGRLKQ
jgi:hypothetical protein